MQRSLRIVGPDLDSKDQCEVILRSISQWFGIEAALVRYVPDTATLPTFAVQGEQLEAFPTLREHLPKAWEIHCIAVRAVSRRKGYGNARMTHAENSLVARGVDLLQVKAVAQKERSSPYDETRPYYVAMGFAPL